MTAYCFNRKIFFSFWFEVIKKGERKMAVFKVHADKYPDNLQQIKK